MKHLWQPTGDAIGRPRTSGRRSRSTKSPAWPAAIENTPSRPWTAAMPRKNSRMPRPGLPAQCAQAHLEGGWISLVGRTHAKENTAVQKQEGKFLDNAL